MPLHTVMPERMQVTPFGEVRLTSVWKSEHYVLRAAGQLAALRWMFRSAGVFEIRTTGARHTFEPSEERITVERQLRAVCARWQQHWNERLAEHDEEPRIGIATTPIFRVETLGQLIDHMHHLRRARIAPTTYQKELHYARHWLAEFGRNRLLANITEQDVVEARGRLAKELKAGTVNCCTNLLKTYLRWAFKQDFLEREPCRDLRRLHDPRSLADKEWWRPEQVALALRCAERDPHQPTAHLLVALGCLLGLRYEEIVMLRWEDLDLDARHPATGEAQPVCRVVPHDGWKPKDGEPRTVPIHRRLLEILLRHRRPEGYILKAEASALPKRPRKEGGKRVYRYDPRAVWRRLMKAVAADGGRPISPNGMRHSFASNLLVAGESDVKVARYLGHADTSMVHRHYGHLLAYDPGINRVDYA